MHEVDALGRRVPSHLGGAVTWFEAIPGLASQFRKTVPKSHLRRPQSDLTVACPCGTETSLRGRTARIVECAGGCYRFFLATGRIEDQRHEVFVAGPYEDEMPA